MEKEFQKKEAFKQICKIHGIKFLAFSDSDSDEGMDTEDYKVYDSHSIDIANCHVYTVTETNQLEEENAVSTNPGHDTPQNTGIVLQNVANNEHSMGTKIIENKNTINTKSEEKASGGHSANLNKLGCLKLSEKSSHIYDIIKANNQFSTTFSENSKKKMQELEEKFKSTKPRVNTTGPLPVSIKDLVRALVVAFLFDIDVKESTIDMFQITTNISMLEHNLKLYFRNMMTQIMISPDNVLFIEYYQKLERLVLHRYKEGHQPCLNGRLSWTVSSTDMAQNQVEKDVNSIPKQDINNQVSESLFDNIQFLDDVLPLSSEGVEIYLAIKECSQLSSTSNTQKLDSPLISKKIQMHLESSFLRAKPISGDSIDTRIRELVRATIIALLFGINVSKSFIYAVITNVLQIDIETSLLEIEVRKYFREMMALLQVTPENPIFFKLYTKLEDLIIQPNAQYLTVHYGDTNVISRVVLPSTGAIPKQKKKRKRKSKKRNQTNDLQELLLPAINQVSATRKIEVKNSQDIEKMVLPKYHSSQAVNQVQTSKKIETKNTESNEDMVLPNYHSSEAANQVQTSRKIELKKSESNEEMVLPNYHSSEPVNPVLTSREIELKNSESNEEIILTNYHSSEAVNQVQTSKKLELKNSESNEEMVLPNYHSSEAVNQFQTSRKIELKNIESIEEKVLPNYHSNEPVNQVLTSREIELKNTESNEKIVLPNYHSSEADLVNKNCTTEDSDTTENTIELYTTPEEFLPGISHVEEVVPSASNALVLYTNYESVVPEDSLLNRIRHLLILYFLIVLGFSFLNWVLTNFFFILMVILVVLFVK